MQRRQLACPACAAAEAAVVTVTTATRLAVSRMMHHRAFQATLLAGAAAMHATTSTARPARRLRCSRR
jgi:hypothetical protein